LGIVEGDAVGGEAVQGGQEVFANAPVVANDFAVGTEVADVFGIKVADDGDMVASSGDKKGRMPGDVQPQYQFQGRIRHQDRFSGEGQPDIDIVLIEDVGRLS
jgi:hypothetical protein